MKTAPPFVSATIPIKKEDLFWVLFRLYQLMNDADPFGDSLDEENEDPIVLQMEIPPEGEEEQHINDVSPPNYFRTLYAAQDDFNVGMINEFIGLFAILSTPLDNDPALKREFIEYARQQGKDIEFTKGEAPPKKPTLSIVPPQKDSPDDGKTPPKK